MKAFPRFLIYFLFLSSSGITLSDNAVILDDFNLTGEPISWMPLNDSPDPILVNETATGGIPVIKMPCNYSLVDDGGRCYWDKVISADLSDFDVFYIRVYISDITPLRRLTIYFRSTGGWYGTSIYPQFMQIGWQTIALPKSIFATEGTPSGWDDIIGIRLSPWKEAGATEQNYIAYDFLQASKDALMIDDFSYANSSSVTNEWQAKSNSSDAYFANSGEWGNQPVSVMPCDYSLVGKDERCYWDRKVNFDLSDFNSLALRVYISDLAPLDRLTIYLHSVSGWYTYTTNKIKPGWQTIHISRHDLKTEDIPAGFDKITSIRLSPWQKKGINSSNFIAYDYLMAVNQEIVIVDDNWNSNKDKAGYITNLLEYQNLNYVKIKPDDVSNENLNGTEIIILPDNIVSPNINTVLNDYVSTGGKVIAYGDNTLDSVSNLLGIQRKIAYTYSNVTQTALNQQLIPALPSKVPSYFASAKNIAEINTNADEPAKVLANWLERDTEIVAAPAWFIHSNGAFSQRAINEYSYNLDERAQFLSLLLANFSPEVLVNLRTNLLSKLDTIAMYGSYEQAVSDITAAASNLPTAEHTKVISELQAADNNRNQALALQDITSLSHANNARQHLQKAYLLTRATPAVGEHHAIWEHSGLGAYPGDWNKTITAIKNAGFEHLILNSARGGTSVYPSNYLDDDYIWNTTTHGNDPLADAVTAAHQHSVKLHYWKVHWNLSRSSQNHITTMRAAGRTQIDVNGDPIDWLSPCHDDNYQLELDVISEVINNYDIDGIHLDYIRFPGTGSYDAACKQKFEAFISQSFSDREWIPAVSGDGAYKKMYQDWRASIITSLVSDIKNMIDTVNAENRPNKPTITLSAALIHRGDANETVAQYWPSWIDAGLLDIAYPMIYADDNTEFKERLDTAITYVNNQIPLYAGLGAWINTPDKIAAQIEWLRSKGLTGFSYFALNEDSADNRIDHLGQKILKD